MTVTTIAIDTAKTKFQLHAADAKGNVVFRKQIHRDELLSFMAQQPRCRVGMEACGGSHHWGRKFQAMQHEVVLIPPQYVKPFVIGSKTDAADAAAISEAMSRPSTRTVPVKTEDQQQMLSIHCTRQRYVKNRTMLVNQLRGILQEFGIVFPKGRPALKGHVQELLYSPTRRKVLPPQVQDRCHHLIEEWNCIDKWILREEKALQAYAKQDHTCRRLMDIPGVGVITATALVLHVGNATRFKSARHLSSYLGLVPKQHSSGGKERMLGISKRGNIYVRSLLVHGARAVINASKRNASRKGYTPTRTILWVSALEQKRQHNRAVVALANKTARIIWALLRNTEARYDSNYLPERCRPSKPSDQVQRKAA